MNFFIPIHRWIGSPLPARRIAQVSISKGPRLDINKLEEAVQYYYEQGLAPSTKKSYLAGQKCYLFFCSAICRQPIPTSEDILLTFISHLAQEGLAYTTIKVYLSAVRSLHVATSHHETFSSQLTPRVEQVLRGIKKVDASKPPSTTGLPVTLEILEKMRRSCGSTEISMRMYVTLWAACCLAFFGFLRCSEFTVSSQTEYTKNSLANAQDLCTLYSSTLLNSGGVGYNGMYQHTPFTCIQH